MKTKVMIFIMTVMMLLSCVYMVNASLLNYNLDGYIIYVDAGHGGKDNGADNQDVLEDSINLSICKLLVKGLIDKGAYVYTSRDGDYDLASNYDKNRKAKDLKKRVELINSIKPDLFISIHLNTYPDIDVKGGQIFFQNNDESESFASILQNEFNMLSKENKKPKLGDYYLLNKTNSVGVIIECGFLTNPMELKKLVKEEYQKQISQVIIESIYKYFKLMV